MDAFDLAFTHLCSGRTLTEAVDLMLEYAGRECPDCRVPLTHMGYFTYECPSCKKPSHGDLPEKPEKPTNAAARRD